MAGRLNPETARIVARLAKAANDVPEPSAATVEEIRHRLLREVLTEHGRTRLRHEALDGIVTLLLQGRRR